MIRDKILAKFSGQKIGKNRLYKWIIGKLAFRSMYVCILVTTKADEAIRVNNQSRATEWPGPKFNIVQSKKEI